jgi:tRNA threonylcarbamoyladenosine biosynthesis protein TsaB
MEDSALLLGIDTCGPSGSVALGRIGGSAVEILGQTELAGRTYSATVITAIGELLSSAQMRLDQLRAIVVVNGPGSFTGVRVGVGAAKGLAEGASLPVVAVSRLEVLAFKAGIPSAALDAHRHELFLRTFQPKAERAELELLAGAEELAALRSAPSRIAVCDEAAATLLHSAWPAAELVHVPPPSAGDALQLCAQRVGDGEFADLALLDGHYLRRSDAEIFGDPGGTAALRISRRERV